MKQRIVLSLFFVCAFMVTTRAQISKGAVWLGGGIGYSESKQEPPFGTSASSSKYNNFSIDPAIGTVVKDNLVVGISLLYNQVKTDNDGSTIKSKTNAYGGGVFVRKYFPVISRLYIFGDANVGFTSTKTDKTLPNYYNGAPVKTTSKGWTGAVSITPGIAFAVSKKFMLETSLSNLFGVAYLSNKTTGPSDYYKSKSHQVAAGISADGQAQFNIGFRFLFNNNG